MKEKIKILAEEDKVCTKKVFGYHIVRLINSK